MRPAVPVYWRCTPGVAVPYAGLAVMPQAQSQVLVFGVRGCGGAALSLVLLW
jgi:hypothetical protein